VLVILKKEAPGFHPFGSTLLEFASRVAMWRKARPPFVTLQESAL